ncbi:hypothetical protein OSB04_027126 [Centaurea solstitialis]|uniref:DRBM domain-containing protein n=1 Tax=Centaurea solstitialis TaxID=347529 RepID=A0AA38W6J4_9ASTR|nr:hypothetical protein OSB04_027126 [Centaurea solstitialis]
MYKSMLHELCQRNKLQVPAYSFIKEGEDHCPTFRGKVVVDDITFISESTFGKAKLATTDVAKQALAHFGTSPRMCFFILLHHSFTIHLLPKIASVDFALLQWFFFSISEVPNKNDEFSSSAFGEEKTTTTPLDSMNAHTYLLFDKFRVYTSMPTTVLPKGCVVLPIDDNKWTIVRLE